ncbi:MAG: PKD domain-containing protein [Actinomycetes bacterium]
MYRRLRVSTLALLLLALGAMLLPAVGDAGSSRADASPLPAVTSPAIQHVVWVWMENRSYNSVIGSSQAPYINSLARTYGSASNAWAITHPSAPNYIGAHSGLPLSQLPASDCTTCTKPGPDLFTQVPSWRAYEESMTTPCRRNQDSGGLYVARHNPALYFTDISAASCAANDVGYPMLATDLANHTLPAFSFVTPNMANDMHDGNIATGDTWLANNLPQLLQSSEFTSGSTVIFLAWDEGSGGGTLKGIDCTTSTSESCHIPLIVISPQSMGTSSAKKLTLYSTLKATEDLLGVPELGIAATAPDLLSDFGLAGVPTPASSFVSSCAGLTCTFDGSGPSSNGSTIAGYSWDFGDGSAPVSDVTTTHTFADSGSYAVSLTVTDALGQSGTHSESVDVQAPSGASFTATCVLLECSVDASASTMPDVASYSWDFGDGTGASGVTAGKTYGSAGGYKITLTLTDSAGGTAVVSHQVTAAAAPTAAFTASCSATTCSFDGSSSTATGSRTLSWDFGDGSASGAGETTTHTYQAPGTYSVTLTVNDSFGNAASTSQSVELSSPPVSFVAATGTSVNALTASVVVPTKVAQGDGLLLIATSRGAVPQSTPSGWQLMQTAGTSTIYSTVWQRVATASDAGSRVTVTLGTSLTKGTLELLAYSGTAAGGPLAATPTGRTGATTTTSFASPFTSVATPGSWVVSYWAARSAYVTSWTAPSGQVVRASAGGTGGGHVNDLATDGAAPVPLGPFGGLVATTDQTSASQVAWTMVLAPRA